MLVVDDLPFQEDYGTMYTSIASAGVNVLKLHRVDPEVTIMLYGDGVNRRQHYPAPASYHSRYVTIRLVMARQELLFAEAISGIKKALSRKDDGKLPSLPGAKCQ